jgi:hypothetical protein
MATVTTEDEEQNDSWKEEIENIIQKLGDGEWEHAGHTESLAEQKYTQGDWVEWDTRNSTEKGKVIGGYTSGDDVPNFRGSRNLSPEDDEILYALRMHKQRDGSWHPIEGKPIGHYEDSVRSTEEPSEISDSPVELGRSNHEQYNVEKDDWVQWYPSEMSEEHGFVLDVDDSAGNENESIVTIEVWTQNDDGDWETDGEEKLVYVSKTGVELEVSI